LFVTEIVNATEKENEKKCQRGLLESSFAS
jgi:hypothetical protein